MARLVFHRGFSHKNAKGVVSHYVSGSYYNVPDDVREAVTKYDPADPKPIAWPEDEELPKAVPKKKPGKNVRDGSQQKVEAPPKVEEPKKDQPKQRQRNKPVDKD